MDIPFESIVDTIPKKFTLDNMVNETINVYKKVLNIDKLNERVTE